MAIAVTQILGTDSIASLRITLNDNFAILKDEINAIETYLDPDAGTIDNLNIMHTKELKVGPAGNTLFEVLSSNIVNINTATIQLSQSSSVLKINGLISHNNFFVLLQSNYSINNYIYTLTPINGNRNYIIKQDVANNNFIIEVNDQAYPGQEISFFTEQINNGDKIIIKGFGTTPFILGIDSNNNPYTQIELNQIGANVTIKAVIDSNNNIVYYIVGGNNYILA